MRTTRFPTRRRAPALRVAAGLAAALAAGGCARAAPAATTAAPAAVELDAVQRARADSARHPYTAADIRFMTAMIGHHAQALVMARLAPTNDASAAVRILADRITNGQRDEIALMQRWLRDRGQMVPTPMLDAPAEAPTDAHAGHDMPAAHADHGGALMPGMLTPAELARLAAARGREFDRLFLTYMIQHHRGAVAMVQTLFGSYGAGQDETVFRFATDVNVDQITEIARMERMLAELLFEDPNP